MHANSRILFEKFARPWFRDGMRVLEIGPDGFPSTYRSIVRNETIRWDTLDMYASQQLTYPGSEPYSFSISDETYDIVISGQVAEHVPKIWRWMPEVARVVKTGGVVITVVPVSWPYHQAPTDCWRMYPDGLAALCEDSGLLVETAFWGSFELPQSRSVVAGRSLEFVPRKARLYYRVAGFLGLPVETAYDTIVVATKPASGVVPFLKPERSTSAVTARTSYPLTDTRPPSTASRH